MSCYQIFSRSTQNQSSQLFSTVSFTRFVYSFRFSLYRFDASTFAGDEVLGSFKRLRVVSSTVLLLITPSRLLPLNTRQNCRNVVCWRPPILEDIQAQFACAVNVRVKHLANKLDAGRLVRVGFFEVHDKAKGAVFKRCVGRSYNDGVPAPWSAFMISRL